jgi:hypothetical protein
MEPQMILQFPDIQTTQISPTSIEVQFTKTMKAWSIFYFDQGIMRPVSIAAGD